MILSSSQVDKFFHACCQTLTNGSVAKDIRVLPAGWIVDVQPDAPNGNLYAACHVESGLKSTHFELIETAYLWAWSESEEEQPNATLTGDAPLADCASPRLRELLMTSIGYHSPVLEQYKALVSPNGDEWLFHAGQDIGYALSDRQEPLRSRLADLDPAVAESMLHAFLPSLHSLPGDYSIVSDWDGESYSLHRGSKPLVAHRFLSRYAARQTAICDYQLKHGDFWAAHQHPLSLVLGLDVNGCERVYVEQFWW